MNSELLITIQVWFQDSSASLHMIVALYCQSSSSKIMNAPPDCPFQLNYEAR